MMMTLLTSAALAAAPTPRELTAQGPMGPLSGTLLDAGKKAPVLVIIPGSGPTDRDGNNPLGVKAQPYKLLAEALAEQGVSSVRVDKRGMFGSKAAIADPNKVTIADYAADANSWAKAAKAATGAKCVWLLGHSEGGLVALKAGQDKTDVCGVISVSAAGRRLGDVMREQLRANPFNAPILTPALTAIDALEAGKPVDVASMPAPIQPLFNASVQPYLMDLFSYDPAKLASSIKVPLLVVQGTRDIQVSMDDARRLVAANNAAKLVPIDGATHVLKLVDSDDRAANMATYTNADLPLAPGIAEAIAVFVTAKR